MEAASSLPPSRRRRLLLAGLAAALPLLFAVRRVAIIPDAAPSRAPAAPRHHDEQQKQHERCRNDDGFTLPAPVVEALLHYAASPETPQLTRAELSLAAHALTSRPAPRNLLVFGLGRDTALWAALNHGGRTVFLEEDASWIAAARAAHPPGLGLEAYHVAYDTVLADAGALLRLRDDPACVAQPDLAAAIAASCGLVPRGLPDVFGEVEWDVILVDAPTGYDPTRPGRMGAIYAAGMAARARRPGATTDALVHNVDRPVEDMFSRAFLCEAYAVEEVGKLRRFVVPSHRGSSDGVVPPFCPPDEDVASV
ncbi:unnamed protein product [Urochloa decumbens]|uniref:Polysaccharide biosynthesis domain-containing protein n=1 Tax=Urochloa decumbens TaxID=240449 RepID=A0ABC8WJS3_9POAL